MWFKVSSITFEFVVPGIMEYHDDAADFVIEDVEAIVRTGITSCLADNMYNPRKVDDWANTIIDAVLKELHALHRAFKYIITCIIMQKNGAGLSTSATMFWDATKDGHCKVSWENQTMHCIVTVYGLSRNIDDPQDLDL